MPDNQQNLLDSALSWAAKGFAVFPCRPLGKEPATGNGLHDATTDAETIRSWWAENPQYNIGVSPAQSGVFVLDVDPPRGEETLALCELENEALPSTLTFKTPRGGRHLWFRGRCPSSVGTEKNGLGPKLDTRGYGGYVLLPPSRVAYDWGVGEYQCTDEREIANGPSWIAERIARNKEHHGASADVELDLPVNIERAGDMLRRRVASGDVAVEGSGGDERTYKLACEVLDLGLSPSRGYSLVSEIWNPHCIPPWSEDELAAKFEHAASYRQNDIGAWAVRNPASLFAHIETPVGPGASSSADATEDKRSRFYPHELSDAEAFKEPAWLIPDLIPRNGTVQITGKQKSFKTFLALDLCLGLAGMAETFGHKPLQSESVVYVAGENPGPLVLKHIPAWCLARGVDKTLLPFRVVQAMPRAAVFEEFDELVREIKKQNLFPSVVVIDTATRALRGLDENSAKDMGEFSAACEFVQRNLSTTVLVIRHTGKDEGRGGRGSNVIEGDFDTILSVQRHDKTSYVQLKVQEQRNAAEREAPYCFEMRRSGDSIVPEPITAAEFAQRTAKEDPYNRTRVGAALIRLKAIGASRAVTTYVLAAELAPPVLSETQEERERVIARCVKQLRLRQARTLAGYCEGEAWFLPPDALEGVSEPAPQAGVDPADSV